MGVARIYRLPTPWNASQLADMDYEQTTNRMYAVHIDHPVRKIVRNDHADWQIETVTFTPTIAPPASVTATPSTPNNGGGRSNGSGTPNLYPTQQAYVVCSISDTTGQQSRSSPAATTSNDLTLQGNLNTISWSPATGADRYAVFKSESGSGVYGFIGTSTGTSFVDQNIEPDFSDTPPIGNNPFDGAGNYPSTVTFFENRLILGRTLNKPNFFFGSRTGDYENMDVRRPRADDDAFEIGLAARRVNAVNHLVATDQLLALTSDAVFAISGANDDFLSGRVPPRARPQIGRGTARLKPIVSDQVVFYRPATGSSVRAIGFAFEINGYRSNDVTVFSPHFFKRMGIVWWAYAQEPLSVIWAGRSDGKLLCFTWEQEQQVWGWTLCETAGRVLSGTVITENGEDYLYVIVERQIGGQTRRTIERMATTEWQQASDACYLDCSRSFVSETPVQTLASLWHLEGAEVWALADGNVVKGLTVSNGKITLPTAARRVTVGLPYSMRLETLPPIRLANGRRHSIKNGRLRVLETRGLKVGANDRNLFPIKDRTNEAVGEATRLKSGIIEASLAPVWGPDSAFVLTSDEPLPATILGVFYDEDANA